MQSDRKITDDVTQPCYLCDEPTSRMVVTREESYLCEPCHLEEIQAVIDLERLSIQAAGMDWHG